MKQELRDGLTLRSLSEGIASDRQNLGQFYLDVFSGEGEDDAISILPWTEDLISGDHPYMTLDDVWVVVDPAADDQIVSALLLIPQIWRYEDIEMLTGRIELVATHKDYRRRGLIRALMKAAHQRSAALGHIIQGITGIEHYYRRFGYAMAVNLGSDAQLPMASIPVLKPDQETRYTLRPAVTDDIDHLLAWQAYEQQNIGLTVKYDRAYWDYQLNHRRPGTPYSVDTRIIVNPEGQDVGFVTFLMDRFYRVIRFYQFIVGEQSSYFDTFDDVLRAIQALADDFYTALPDDKYPVKLIFDNGLSPSIKSIVRKLDGGILREQVYTWYIRVEDIPAFIQHIRPVLEQRLVGSAVNCFSGELKIGFFALNGIKIVFEDGCITEVTTVALEQYGSDTAMPYDTFLNVLFGHRNWRELAYILPEVYANRKADLLLSALFPKMRAHLGEAIG